jgi:hypothetical protein
MQLGYVCRCGGECVHFLCCGHLPGLEWRVDMQQLQREHFRRGRRLDGLCKLRCGQILRRFRFELFELRDDDILGCRRDSLYELRDRQVSSKYWAIHLLQLPCGHLLCGRCDKLHELQRGSLQRCDGFNELHGLQ